jgi:hypothetical protein
MSKGVKTVITIAVAVAIPFVAPAIASSIGLSAAIGSTAGSALVGAGLGAANASIMGGDVKRGALMGGIGGGIGGYNYTPSVDLSTPTATNMSSYTNPAAQQAASPETYNAATGTYSAPVTDSFVATNASGYTDPAAQQAAGLDTTGSFAAPTNASGYTDPAAQQAAGLDTTGSFAAPTNASGYTNQAARQAASPETYNAATGTYSAPTVPTTFVDALKSVPGTIAERFKDPKALADLTLQAAGQLAGSYFAGDGMSDEEKRLLKAQTDELRALQQSNKLLFDQKLQAAQDLIGESKYFDPEYFGLQRARKTQLAGAKAKQRGLRGLTGARRAAEERRFDLATGRDTGSAFDQGFGAGVTGRTQTLQAGLSGMPGYLTGSDAGYTNIYNQYAAADRRSRDRSGDIGDLFGTLTGSQKSKQSA